MFKSLAIALTTLSLSASAAFADEVIEGSVRTGWRMADGSHMAALHLELADGWKTYWRAPGDSGIPPAFDWSGSANIKGVEITWPTPDVFWQDGIRSVGYKHALVLPIRITPETDGDITMSGELGIGLCRDICLPHTLKFHAVLTDEIHKPDPVIAASLASVPYNRNEAAVRTVTCSFLPSETGVVLRAVIDMPPAGGKEAVVVEVDNPTIWVAEPTSTRQGRQLTTETTLESVSGRAFALNRSNLRITVLGKRHAVDIQGCD